MLILPSYSAWLYFTKNLSKGLMSIDNDNDFGLCNPGKDDQSVFYKICIISWN